MTAFVVVAGFLAVAVGAAIALPLWRSRAVRGSAPRDANLAVLDEQRRELDDARGRGEISAESHARAVAELQARVKEEYGRAPERWAPSSWGPAGWIAAACVPAVAAVLYVVTGSPGATTRVPAPAPSGKEAPHGPGNRQAAVAIELLSARLRDKPEDGEGWAMLGRSFAATGNFKAAADALGQAAARLPGNAAVLADRADVLAMAQGRRFAGEPDLLIQAALQADPRHAKALALAGTSAFDRGDYAVAASHWRRLLETLPPKGETAREVEARIREAERLAGSASSSAITGTVSFAEGKARALEAGDVIFVVARPRDGKGRPVAVARLRPSSFPATFRLDDADSLLPASPLSGFSEVLLEARLARGGSADPRPGDPRSAPRAARPGDRAVALELRAPG
ncbi:MAG: c-type cytochrome biogenesis protein CcmI [Lysobacter sp.]|nr:c-type cytochrome biogenesis protein CcmI [Lysobacter sp.]